MKKITNASIVTAFVATLTTATIVYTAKRAVETTDKIRKTVTSFAKKDVKVNKSVRIYMIMTCLYSAIWPVGGGFIIGALRTSSKNVCEDCLANAIKLEVLGLGIPAVIALISKFSDKFDTWLRNIKDEADKEFIRV